MNKSILGISISLILLVSAVIPAMAQEGTTDTTIQGIIQSIDGSTCSFTILTAEGTTITATLPEGTDCSTLVVGDNIEVTGTLNEDGTLSASGVVVLPPVEEEEAGNTGHYCSTEGSAHPALTKLTEAYGTDYASVLDMFCGQGLGVGGVAHALNTAEEFGVSQDEVLAMRETMGWGQIWKALKAAASGDDGGQDESAAGPGNGNGNGHGNGNAGGNNGNGGGNGNGNGKKD